MQSESLTVEALESLVLEAEQDEAKRRAELGRVVVALAKLFARRNPGAFTRRPLSITDQPGHWDSSYPPKEAKHYGRGAPRLYTVWSAKIEDVPTSSGAYYSYTRSTEYGGLYVDREGVLYELEQTGTGRVARYAAHPGDCDRDYRNEWLVLEEPSLEQLEDAERDLRNALSEAVRAA